MRSARADVGAIVAAVALAAVLAGTALVVDTSAAAAFDAPKRLIALVGTAIAAAAAFAFRRPGPEAAQPWREGPRARRVALWLAAAALGMALVAAMASPRRGPALDATRSVIVFALLLPLGASRVVEKGRSWLAGVFIGATAVNAVVSILESRGRFQPFLLETVGDRQSTGAYAGNVGYLAITLALAGVVALGLLFEGRGSRARVLSGAALALFAAALVVNLNLTALTAALAGAARPARRALPAARGSAHRGGRPARGSRGRGLRAPAQPRRGGREVRAPRATGTHWSRFAAAPGPRRSR